MNCRIECNCSPTTVRLRAILFVALRTIGFVSLRTIGFVLLRAFIKYQLRANDIDALFCCVQFNCRIALLRAIGVFAKLQSCVFALLRAMYQSCIRFAKIRINCVVGKEMENKVDWC